MTVNPNPDGPLRNIIGGFKLVIKGTSRQGEFNALHDPGDCNCDPLQLDSKTIPISKLINVKHIIHSDKIIFNNCFKQTRRYHQGQSSGRKTFYDRSHFLSTKRIAVETF